MVLPVALLTHPGLTDCDVRVLLALDLIGWREGPRDGLVRASNKEIGDRIGKKPNTVRASLQHMESLQPPLIERTMLTTTTRTLRLRYDRLARSNPLRISTPSEIRPPQNSEGVRNPSTPPQKSEGAPQKSEGVVQNLEGYPLRNPRGTPSEIRGAILFDIKERDHQEDHQRARAEESPQGSDPAEPGKPANIGLAQLLDWLPCITDVEDDLDRLRKKAPAWVERIERRCPAHARRAAEWVQDALITACDKRDMVDYAQKLLTSWVGAGGRPDFELAPARPEPAPDVPGVPVSYAPAPAHRPTQAQRAQAERERIREGFRLNKIRKEAMNADRP